MTGSPSASGQAPADPAAAGQTDAAGRGNSQPPDPMQRIDGLRAWLAQVDRRLGVRTYLGAALAVLAVAAAAIALFLALSVKQDAATKDDLQSVRDQVSGVEQSAAQAAQSGVRSINQRLTALESRVDRLSTDQTTSKRELQVIQDDIKELRSQVSGGSTSGTGSSTGFGGTGTGSSAGTGTGTGAGGTGP